MSSNMNSAAVNSTNSAPYVTSDRTELAPLCAAHQDSKGLRVIVIFFSLFTVVVSMALVSQLHHGDYQVVPHGSVVSDDGECSKAGIAMMQQGGSAVDAVIATMFCLSVVLPHLVGIGGGGYMMVYDQRQRTVVGCLDFQAATGTGTGHPQIGVPGFVAGLYQAHRTHGRLAWPALIQPAIEIAQSGFKPSASLMSAVALAQDQPELAQLLASGANPRLLRTLQTLAHNGSAELYSGSLSSQLTQFVSEAELAAYKVVSDTCQEQLIGQYKVAVAGPGSGGPLLLQMIRKMNFSLVAEDPIVSVAMDLKETLVGSRKYSNGVNVVALDHNDVYVSAVGGLGSVLGSRQLSSGGYLLNDLNTFTFPHSSADDRPAALASPVIVTQAGSACGNRFVMGSNDVRDSLLLLSEMLHAVGNNYSVQSVASVPRARIFSSQVLLEEKWKPQLDPEQLALLQSMNLTFASAPLPYPSLNVVHKVGDTVTPVADPRGGGAVAEF